MEAKDALERLLESDIDEETGKSFITNSKKKKLDNKLTSTTQRISRTEKQLAVLREKHAAPGQGFLEV
jgi:hypothetical protein